MNNTKTFLIAIISFIVIHSYAQYSSCGGGNDNLMDIAPSKPDQHPFDSTDVPVYIHKDPNEIVGLDSYDVSKSTDTLRWVSSTQSLAYTIYFENDAELAMSAASKLTITMSLHEKLNYATFGVGNCSRVL